MNHILKFVHTIVFTTTLRMQVVLRAHSREMQRKIMFTISFIEYALFTLQMKRSRRIGENYNFNFMLS